jgi:hypothetical protein
VLRQAPYAFGHMLVMEELLGRYLTDNENAHHRNGVRDDSRPENLELWTRPQPSGIRASDAVARAWEPRACMRVSRHLQEGSRPKP